MTDEEIKRIIIARKKRQELRYIMIGTPIITAITCAALAWGAIGW